MAELSNETEKLKKKNYNKLRKISEFSIISELSNETEKRKKQNCNKPRNISDFSNETENKRNEIQKRKIVKTRQIFQIFKIIKLIEK